MSLRPVHRHLRCHPLVTKFSLRSWPYLHTCLGTDAMIDMYRIKMYTTYLASSARSCDPGLRVQLGAVEKYDAHPVYSHRHLRLSTF